ncbi:MAG: hypothetical protein ACOZIN_13645, partial [Myxococcota bacterium]
ARTCGLFVGLALGCLVGQALAQGGPRLPELDQAQEHLDAGDFEAAVSTLNRGLASPDVTDEQLVELYRLLGLAQLYLGHEDKARQAFEKLLQARPDFEVPKGAPPKVKALYARIKEDIRKRRLRPVTLSVDPLLDTQGGQPLELTARVENVGLGASVKLYYRRAGVQAYSSVNLRREQGAQERFVAQIPAFELPAEKRAYDIEYYLEVADAAQRRLAGRGDPFRPSTFRVLPPTPVASPAVASTPWYQNPWLWVGAGVVAAGATAGVVFVATQKQTGSLPITIRVEGGP